MASGINGTFRQVGMAVGIAAYGAVFQHTIRTNVVHALAKTRLAHRSIADGNIIAAGGTPSLLAHTPAAHRAALKHVAASSFSAGLNEIFLLGALVAVVGAVAGLCLVRARDSFEQSDKVALPAG
jgi:hypothetical protein